MTNNYIKIRNILGYFFGSILLVFGFIRRAKTKAQSGQYITGIAFHNPEKFLFEKSVKWLMRNGYSFISTDDLIHILKRNSICPKGAVWLTFDDGWKNNIENVVPVLKKYNIPATFFITTGSVENSGSFWWRLTDRYKDVLENEFNIKKEELYHIENIKREQIFTSIENRFKSSITREAMSMDEVKELSKISQITLGNHTVNHVITPNCTISELEYEICESKTTLQNWTGEKIYSFAYPNGAFDEREKGILQNADIKIAATIENRLINMDEDIYLIPRFVAMDTGSLMENICHMTGIWEPFMAKLKKMILNNIHGRFICHNKK